MKDNARWLGTEEAAAYLQISVEGFRRKVRAGIIPAPSQALGAALPRWDRNKLDAIMGGGVTSTNPEEAANAIAQELASKAQGRARRAQGAR